MDQQNGAKPIGDWLAQLLPGKNAIHENLIDAIVKTDLSGKIIDANITYQEMLGYSLE